MTWPIIDDSERAIIAEIERQTDRGVAIMGGAFVEQRLISALRSRFVQLSNTIHERIFENEGPLARFSSKIDIAFAIGLCGTETRTGLHHIRYVRNKFAHTLHPIDFNDKEIKNRCVSMRLADIIGELELPDSYQKPESVPQVAKDVFILATKLVMAHLHHQSTFENVPAPSSFSVRL